MNTPPTETTGFAVTSGQQVVHRSRPRRLPASPSSKRGHGSSSEGGPLGVRDDRGSAGCERLITVLERRCDPIWYALATSPTLTGSQWRAVVEHAFDGMDDRELLRLLFERPDRSEQDRLWLLGTVYSFCLDEVLASPVATVEHARQVLARRDEPRQHRRADDETEARVVAEGLTRNPRLAEDDQLVQLAGEVMDRIEAQDALRIARRWPEGQPVPVSLLWRLLDRAVSVRPMSRGPWNKPATEPVPGTWSWLWPLLRQVPAPPLTEAAQRYPRVQAVLLEHGSELNESTLTACLAVLADPQLGGSDPLTYAGRLATLRRWIERHPPLAGPGAPYLASAARDAVHALGRGEEWGLVDELVLSTTDPNILADAVRQIASRLDLLLTLSDLGAAEFRHDPDRDEVWRAAGKALATLAGSPHTPDDVLVEVLPLAPVVTCEDLADARPHLADECTAERLARPGMHQVKKIEPLVDVADDAELAATGNPAAALTGYLTHLPQANRHQANRLAVRLLRSRYTDATVLAALPAEVVLCSPWHAALAGEMLAEACGDDPLRWAAERESFSSGLTFGGYLAQLREYVPTRPGSGLAGYRHCHACLLISPHAWIIFGTEQPQDRRLAERRQGWMTCQLCRHQAPPAALLPADISRPCPACGAPITHPAKAAVLQCPTCEQRFFAPDLPADLRPRIDAVLAAQQRTAELVQQLADRIDAVVQDDAPLDARGLSGSGVGRGRPAPLDPDQPLASVTTQRFMPRPELTPPNLDWLTDEPAGRQFRSALAAAIRHSKTRPRTEAALLRYGLGRTRRPRTVTQIASKLGVTAGTAQQRINDCLREIYLAVLAARSPAPTAGERACIVATHLANQALGDLDFDGDDDLAIRIAELLTTALPDLDAGAGVRLLLRLTGRQRDLNQVHTTHLIMMVDAELS
jgi:hypothetical protein